MRQKNDSTLIFCAIFSPVFGIWTIPQAANKKWRQEEEVVDDITCVLMGFHENFAKLMQ
jgi:hypothetical protein